MVRERYGEARAAKRCQAWNSGERIADVPHPPHHWQMDVIFSPAAASAYSIIVQAMACSHSSPSTRVGVSTSSVLSRPSRPLQESSLPCATRRNTGRLACTRRILSQIAPGGSTHGWARGAPILLPLNYGLSESVRGTWIHSTRRQNWLPDLRRPGR